MASRIVRPETCRLDLSGGEWILIKKQLNHGEQSDMFARLYIAGVDGQLRANPLLVGMAQVVAYLLDWNLLGLDEQPLIIAERADAQKEAILRALSPEAFGEIRDAVQQHIATIDAERDAAKNPTGGESKSSAISPSRAGVAGAIATSVN